MVSHVCETPVASAEDGSILLLSNCFPFPKDSLHPRNCLLLIKSKSLNIVSFLLARCMEEIDFGEVWLGKDTTSHLKGVNTYSSHVAAEGGKDVQMTMVCQ